MLVKDTNRDKVNKGFVWVLYSSAFNKFLSLISQIVLGYFLAVETYGVFGIIISSMIFVHVFQNSGISKVLINQPEKYDGLINSYSSFSFLLSIFGCFLLIFIGLYEANKHSIEGLELVYLITALSIPLVSLASILGSKLSVDLKFKFINFNLIIHAFTYYLCTMLFAWMGLEIFTIAVSVFIASVVQFIVLKKIIGAINIGFTISFSKFFELLFKFRLVLFVTLLSSVAMRGDFLILTNMLSLKDIGYYYFGFMLVMSITVVISTGINQTLLPFFSTFNQDFKKLYDEFYDLTSKIAAISSALCLFIVIFLPDFIHYAWSGKWDSSILVVIITAFFIPLRLLATLSYTVLESKGMWKERVYFSIFEILVLIFFVYFGAIIGGLIGACIGIASQRILSGLVSFSYVLRVLNIDFNQTTKLIIEEYSPFYVFTILYLMVMYYLYEGFLIDNSNATQLITSLILKLTFISVFFFYLVRKNRDLFESYLNMVKGKFGKFKA